VGGYSCAKAELSLSGKITTRSLDARRRILKNFVLRISMDEEREKNGAGRVKNLWQAAETIHRSSFRRDLSRNPCFQQHEGRSNSFEKFWIAASAAMTRARSF
jgi:hypothetical protein